METAARVIKAFDAVTAAQKTLHNLGVVRSQRTVSDYGEWIAAKVLGLELTASPVQRGWDLEGPGRRVQVKAHAKAATNNAKRTTLKGPALDFEVSPSWY